ncbi:hypothetical protein HJC23_007660 [Cyclotella cryptica]|uniref:ABC transporter domain-containing protein n=1 Tax=Cyclotella cryptica TaxID=29204 RepID=A0ABD3NSL8_9STRA
MIDHCIELRISEEDVSSEGNNLSAHRHKSHHHGSHPRLDSSNWVSNGDEKQPGIMAKSKVPIGSDSFLSRSAKTVSPVSTSILGNTRRASTTEERRNPFAVREGNTFMWQDINMTLGERKILRNVWGELHPGKITAIMGISGAGKSSLLRVLSGRCQSSSKVAVESDVRLNHFKVDPTDIEVRKQIAFVTQDDALSFTATPREAIKFSAKLRLPRVTTDEEIRDLTDKMIAELGLEDCADSTIGGELVTGISGGERKRTSIEPTSGLDSVSALQVINVLKKIARAGCSVLFTIHQPSSEVFNSFDRLILLNRGIVMYQGTVDACPEYFAQHNYPVPKNYNPADWIMTIAQKYSQEQLLSENFCTKNYLCLSTAAPPEDDALVIPLGVGGSSDISDDEWKHVTFGTEVRLLFRRELTHNLRNRAGVGARFALTTFVSLLAGSIFFDVGSGNDINSHFGGMVMMLMISMFGTALPTLISFPEERPVFLREYSTNHSLSPNYPRHPDGVAAYFISKLSIEALVTCLQVLEILLIVYFMVDLQAPFYKFLPLNTL